MMIVGAVIVGVIATIGLAVTVGILAAAIAAVIGGRMTRAAVTEMIVARARPSPIPPDPASRSTSGPQ
jgi:hypothetical protein